MAAGWKVTYIVVRDYSKAGNYFYEPEIYPEGVNVIRVPMPMAKARDRAKSHLWRTILTQIAGLRAIRKLSREAHRFLKKNEVDVLYGYEVHGVCAVKRYRFWHGVGKMKIVSRFQGTWMSSYIRDKRWLKKWLNFDDVFALKSKADLAIMTNDGTDGDFAMKKLRSKALHNLKFWVNGVDELKMDASEYADLKEKYNSDGTKLVLCSISRLESWKRVDRILNTVKTLMQKHDFKDFVYLMIGEGGLKPEYEQFLAENELSDFVKIIGAIPNTEVKKYLNFADVFLSTYDLSNVGNPLLEAIRCHKIIFTLNNGSTSDWIVNGENGFIYDVDENLHFKIAEDIIRLSNDKELKEKIIGKVRALEKDRLWTWKERLDAEVKAVEDLFENEN